MQSVFFVSLIPIGGDEGNRTLAPLLAGQVLSQLSYTPVSGFAVLQNRTTSRKTVSLIPSGFSIDYSKRIFRRFRLTLYLVPVLHRKEVIQPHLPIRLPCYDFTPVAYPTFGSALLAVRLLTSGVINSHCVTGGVYKARERIHRGMLIRDY